MNEDKSKKLKVKLSSSIWAKPKIDKLKLLKGVFNIIKNVSSAKTFKPLNWTSVPGDIIDSISAISFKEDVGQVGWKLISRSIVDALVMIIIETSQDFEEEDIETEELDKELSTFLEDDSYFIDFDFFQNPSKHPFITKVKPLLSQFLVLCGFDKTESDNMMVRFNGYLVYSLANEWQSNSKYYGLLKESLSTPFDEAAKREYEWQLNTSYLEKQINRPVFSESFSLKQIYMPLRAFYLQTKDGSDTLVKHTGEFKRKRIAVDLERYLVRWLDLNEPKDAIRIIRGGPGCGKSSFLRMLAANLSSSGRKVLFIPLHRFEIKEDLDVAVNNFLRYDQIISHNPFDIKEKLILIFDGLDELSMQGKVLSDLAQSFLREVQRKVNNYNNLKLRLQVIISGRDVIVQQNENDFRKDDAILSLLPYYLFENEQNGISESEQVDIKKDQREEWWIRYGVLNGKKYKGLPKELKKQEIDEITAQPLLNYLVALSYERGKVEFNDNTNLNQIYNDLLEAVHERSYADGTHKTVCKMELPHFKRVLEEIAICTWHGNGRTTTVTAIEKHIKDSGLEMLFHEFVGNADKGVISLLAAFYFRQAGQQLDGNQTFEFTHKSFGEYLTAKRIVNQIFIYPDQLNLSETSFNTKGWTIDSCLSSWIRLFGVKELDDDLVKFIRNELVLIDMEELNKLQDTITTFINRVISKGLPMEAVTPRAPTFAEENTSAINAEKAMLVILSLISDITEKLSNIIWTSDLSFGDWFGRLKGQRPGGYCFMLQFVNHLNLDGCILHISDLFYANMKASSLRNSQIQYSCLVGVNLDGSNLNDSDFVKSNMTSAELNNSSFVNADLTGVNFTDATMVDCNLHDAKLEYATLRMANLNSSNLKFANFKYADLEEADLTNANLEGANLEGAILKNANLEGANLEGAILKNANLTGANVKNTILDVS